MEHVVACRRDGKHRIIGTKVEVLHVLEGILLRPVQQPRRRLSKGMETYPCKGINERPKLFVHRLLIVG